MIAHSTKNIIRDFVAEINEIVDELMKEEETDLCLGQRLAYAEVISILQCCCAGEDLKELNLDFDPDTKYL